MFVNVPQLNLRRTFCKKNKFQISLEQDNFIESLFVNLNLKLNDKSIYNMFLFQYTSHFKSLQWIKMGHYIRNTNMNTFSAFIVKNASY